MLDATTFTTLMPSYRDTDPVLITAAIAQAEAFSDGFPAFSDKPATQQMAQALYTCHILSLDALYNSDSEQQAPGQIKRIKNINEEVEFTQSGKGFGDLDSTVCGARLKQLLRLKRAPGFYFPGCSC